MEGDFCSFEFNLEKIFVSLQPEIVAVHSAREILAPTN